MLIQTKYRFMHILYSNLAPDQRFQATQILYFNKHNISFSVGVRMYTHFQIIYHLLYFPL